MKLKKRPLKDFLLFRTAKCQEGEKHLMGHCHKKTKYMIDVMSWIAVIVISIVGIGMFTKLLKGFFTASLSRRRKLT